MHVESIYDIKKCILDRQVAILQNHSAKIHSFCKTTTAAGTWIITLTNTLITHEYIISINLC